MKLLGWMHRKLKHNFNEAAKNRTTSFDDDNDQKYHAETTYGFSVSGNPTYQKVGWNKETEGTREEEKPLNELLFHGFLAIGTLGASEPFNTDPPTPTFPTTSFEDEDVTSHETTQITEQDLKLITKELEKFLEAEEAASEDAQSSKRSSYASIITLSGKQALDDDKTQDSAAPTLLDCPLQKYFFGSSIIELSEADMAVKKEEASSEELEVLKGKYAGDKKQGKAQFAKNFMKKMLKNLNSKSKTHATESASIKKKFPKVLKMFKKKVHPERLIDGKESEKVENRVVPIKGSRPRSRSDTGNTWFHQMMMTPEEEEYFESGRGGAFMENNEHWIKTDADYLVLEL